MAKKDKTANSDIQIFCYKAMPVRTVKIDGETWFVAKDVCEILELSDVSMATQNLEDDEKGTSKVCTPGGMQDMTIISEAGLYTLLVRSNKDEAKPFWRWVTHDVLPTIRKTGSYAIPSVSEKPEKKCHISSGWVKTVSKIIDMALSAETDEDFQKVIAVDRVFKQETGYSALKAAGIYIDTVREGTEFHEWNWHCMNWKFHYKLRLDKALTLPEPYSDEYTTEE